MRLHRGHVVNLDRVRELRRQADGVGWEVKARRSVQPVATEPRQSAVAVDRRALTRAALSWT